MDWDDYRVFLAVAEEGSLAAGARRLGLTQPTARRRLESLEQELGAVLLTRSASGVTPTATGLKVAEQARAMALAAAAAERDATLADAEVSGRVRLTAPVFIGYEVLPPILTRLRRAHPRLDIELELSDAATDLLRRGADVAVRMFPPTQDALVAKRLTGIDIAFFASKDYMADRAPPLDLADLSARFDIIGPDRSETDLAITRDLAPEGAGLNLALRTDHHAAGMSLVRAGFGVGATQVPTASRDPSLVRLLPDLTLFRLDMWLVMHEELRALPRVRALFDHLATELDAYARGEA